MSVILTLTSETKTNRKIAYRIYNEETSKICGFVLAQEGLKVEETENGVILGTPTAKSKKTKPVTPDNGDNGEADGNGEDGDGETCTTETFDDNPSIGGTGDTTQHEDETGVDATLDGAPEYDNLVDSLKAGGTLK